MSPSHGIKALTTDEAFQEQCFLWEKGASKIFRMQNNILYIKHWRKDKRLCEHFSKLSRKSIGTYLTFILYFIVYLAYYIYIFFQISERKERTRMVYNITKHCKRNIWTKETRCYQKLTNFTFIWLSPQVVVVKNHSAEMLLYTHSRDFSIQVEWTKLCLCHLANT